MFQKIWNNRYLFLSLAQFLCSNLYKICHFLYKSSLCQIKLMMGPSCFVAWLWLSKCEVKKALKSVTFSLGLENFLSKHTTAFRVRVSHRKHYAFKRGKEKKSSGHARQDVTYTRLATSSRFIFIKLCVSSGTLHMRLCVPVYHCWLPWG